MTDFLKQLDLKSPNTVFGALAIACTVAALKVGDWPTQTLAGALAVVFALMSLATTVSTRDAITAKDIAALPQDKPIMPGDLVDPTPPPEKKTEQNVLEVDPRDTSTNFSFHAKRTANRPPDR